MGARAYKMIEELQQHFVDNSEKMDGDIIEKSQMVRVRQDI